MNNVLTKEIATLIVNNQHHWYIGTHNAFQEFTAIEDDSIDILLASNYKQWIRLPGLKIVSSYFVEFLQKHKDHLILGIENLDNPNIAKALLNRRKVLQLDNLKTIDPICEKFFKTKISCLILPGLETISDNLAIYLGQHKGDLIIGTKYFTAQQLSSLLPHVGSIWFQGLERLDIDGFEVLARFDQKLQLDHLMNITPKEASVLAKNKTSLFLFDSGISNESLLELVKHQGYSLSFNNAKNFDDISYKIMSGYTKHLRFGNIKNLSSRIADYFINYPSYLEFYGVDYIEDGVLEKLKTAKYLYIKMSDGIYYDNK